MKIVSDELILTKKEENSIHKVKAFVLDRYDFKRNKKGNLVSKAKEIAFGLDTLDSLLDLSNK